VTQNEEADAVGYKRPPREHQFRPGQSGNPSGRPKGARNFKSELREELGELVTIRDGEREIQVGVEQERGPFHPNRFLRKPYVASSLNRMENFFMSRVFSRSHVPDNS
jgi:hypothetical protein